MTKPTVPPSRLRVVPAAPKPSSKSAADGMAEGHALAAHYLRDAVRLLAAIAFGDSQAALHTRMLCAKEIVAIATAVPQTMPAPPPGDGGDAA